MGGSESFPFPFRSFPKLLKPFPVADYSFPGKGKDPFLSQNYWNLSQLQTTPFLGKERILSFPKITDTFPSCNQGKDLSTPNMGNKVNLLQPTNLNFPS